MKEVRLFASGFEGYGVTVTIEGDIEEYAKSFLAIYNNVRENRELLAITNHYNNDVTVYCEEETRTALIEYLENYGKIKSVEKVMLYQVDKLPDYDIEKYEEAVLVPFAD